MRLAEINDQVFNNNYRQNKGINGQVSTIQQRGQPKLLKATWTSSGLNVA